MGNILKWLQVILLIIFIVVLLLGLLIAYATITDFSPDEKTEIDTKGTANSQIEKDSLSFLIWNIGYAGLGAESDFFYDGGKNVVMSEEVVSKNLSGINTTLKKFKNTDFILLQEVDLRSKRSHLTNEVEVIAKTLPNTSYATGINYNVQFVPVPFNNPLGKVRSGVTTYAKYNDSQTTRYQFPGKYEWPKSVFFLDRCFLFQRFPLLGGKDLIVINTHNSAYDNGSLKKQEMEYLKNVLLEEYERGNYIVVGGDWNQTPPGFDKDTFLKEETGYEQMEIPANYMPEGWQWVFDTSVATNRKLAAPYDRKKTFTTLIDFFLISPNLEIQKVEGMDIDFQFSDHQPVYMEVVLKK